MKLSTELNRELIERSIVHHSSRMVGIVANSCRQACGFVEERSTRSPYEDRQLSRFVKNFFPNLHTRIRLVNRTHLNCWQVTALSSCNSSGARLLTRNRTRSLSGFRNNHCRAVMERNMAWTWSTLSGLCEDVGFLYGDSLALETGQIARKDY